MPTDASRSYCYCSYWTVHIVMNASLRTSSGPTLPGHYVTDVDLRIHIYLCVYVFECGRACVCACVLGSTFLSILKLMNTVILANTEFNHKIPTHLGKSVHPFDTNMAYITFYRDTFYTEHDDVIKWKHFPRYWPFVRRIHRSPVNSPHKGQWRRALMFSLICVWINGWVTNREAGDLRHYRTHYDVIVMGPSISSTFRQWPPAWHTPLKSSWCLWVARVSLLSYRNLNNAYRCVGSAHNCHMHQWSQWHKKCNKRAHPAPWCMPCNL